ncbi:MAG: helix-turn-helix transcriptional regulator [Lentisphaeria bacterium]|jgi:AraC-like DNA-binding protein|nr:helix-turn-helix transcriptional regulator [Lentisphaeria bacterium]
MAPLHQRDHAIERLNNLLDLDIDHVETLSFDFHQVLRYPRNILSFALAAEAGAGDYYEDVGNGAKLVFEPGFVYLLPVGSTVRFERSQRTRTVTLHFSLELVRGIDLLSQMDGCVRFYDPAAVERMRLCLEDPDKLRAACGIRQEVLRICHQFWPRQVPDYDAVAGETYAEVFRLIRRHGDAALGVGDLAALMHQRQDVFSRSFKRAFGVPPGTVLRNALLRRVSGLLLDRGRSVKDVARELRFSSEFYLSRFFKKCTGLSPRDYRSQHHG